MSEQSSVKRKITNYSWLILSGLIILGLGVSHWYIDEMDAEIPFSLKYPLDHRNGPNLSTYQRLYPMNLEFDNLSKVVATKEDKPTELAKEYYSSAPMLNTKLTDKEQVDAEKDLNELLELPLYYHNKSRKQLSAFSQANKYVLNYEALEQGFGWYQKGDKQYLLRDKQPYTGWFFLPFQGLTHFNQGEINQLHFNLIEINKLFSKAERLEKLLPRVSHSSVLFSKNDQINYQQHVLPRNYSILIKNPELLILTSPPGTDSSALVTTTEDYIDFPFEVIGEMETSEGKWLHLNVGYKEFGWVKKDPNLQDYVTTYYSERNLLDNIAYVMREEMAAIYADVGASFVNNDTMAQVSVNNHKFFPASTQKIYVLGELYRQYANGQLTSEDVATLYEHNRVPGAGIVQGYSEGSQFSLNELVNLVTTISDNTAANILITMVGGGEVINPYLHQMDLKETFVTGKYYHFDDTYFRTSPADAARYFAFLSRHQLNGDPYDSELIDKFKMNTHTYIRSNLYSVPSWNKSGTGGTEQNDVATFSTDLGNYSLAVYTANPAHYFSIPNQLAQLSYRIYQVYMEIRSDLYVSVEDPVSLTKDLDYQLAIPTTEEIEVNF